MIRPVGRDTRHVTFMTRHPGTRHQTFDVRGLSSPNDSRSVTFVTRRPGTTHQTCHVRDASSKVNTLQCTTAKYLTFCYYPSRNTCYSLLHYRTKNSLPIVIKLRVVHHLILHCNIVSCITDIDRLTVASVVLCTSDCVFLWNQNQFIITNISVGLYVHSQ